MGKFTKFLFESMSDEDKTKKEFYDAYKNVNKDWVTVKESSLPPGFNSSDVESVAKFIEDEKKAGELKNIKIEGVEIDEAIEDADVKDIDIDKLKKSKVEPEKKGKGEDKLDISQRPEKMLHKSNIVDEHGNLIDNDELRKKIMVRPAKLIGQNSKIGKSGTNQTFYDLTLPSYQGLYVDEKTGDFKVVRTCPSAGACSKFCYASKGGYIMFPGSSMSSTRVINYLMNDYDAFKAQLISELNAAQNKEKKSGKEVVLRWHDSGDFISETYLQMAFDIAKETPNVLHYAYTKQVPLVRKMEAHKPENFVFNFSFGGTHDETIDTKKEKHAQVVPSELFKDLDHEKTANEIIFTQASIKELKDRVAKKYDIDVNSILTYDEMMKTPKASEPKYNVLVWKGHGDDAATRKDVLGTYLLFH